MSDKEIKMNKSQFNKLIQNTTLLARKTLAGYLGQSFEGNRDYYDTFGYKDKIAFNNYMAKYQRQDIAGRIIDAPADETWKDMPDIHETDDEERNTEFEKAWDKLEDRLRISHYFKRADKLSRIGEFGVLLIGAKGKGKLSDEMPKLSGPEDIIFLAPYSQGRVDIDTFEDDPFNPRFRLPKYYSIEIGNNTLDSDKSKTTKVHHSRVIHIADNLEEDEIYGRPDLKRVYNLLDDLYKVAGGSPEMFWQNARKGLHADISEEFDPGTEDMEDLQDELDEYFNGLRRYVRTQGVELKDLGVSVANPKPTFEVIMSLISATTGIPKRILLGSERGELSSSQDAKNWSSIIKTRQTNFAEPTILRPFIDRLIKYGALPKVEYKINWHELIELDDKEKAEMHLSKAKAANEYAKGAAGSIVDIEKILRDELNLPINDLEEEPLDEEDDEVQEQFNNLN
ncbi:MAG: anti-CBASS protein Acb1 family protein [Bacillota bacterium]